MIAAEPNVRTVSGTLIPLMVCAGMVTALTLKVFPSGSESLVSTFPVSVTPCGAAFASSLAYKSLVVFADNTVTKTDADAVPPFPSEMV